MRRGCLDFSPMSKRSQRSRSHSPGALVGSSCATLAELDARRVAVHLVVDGREQFLKGLAQFEEDRELGRVLRVKIADPSGNFEFVFSESKWQGQILPGQAVGCDYLLRLA